MNPCNVVFKQTLRWCDVGWSLWSIQISNLKAGRPWRRRPTPQCWNALTGQGVTQRMVPQQMISIPSALGKYSRSYLERQLQNSRPRIVWLNVQSNTKSKRKRYVVCYCSNDSTYDIRHVDEMFSLLMLFFILTIFNMFFFELIFYIIRCVDVASPIIFVPNIDLRWLDLTNHSLPPESMVSH